MGCYEEFSNPILAIMWHPCRNANVSLIYYASASLDHYLLRVGISFPTLPSIFVENCQFGRTLKGREKFVDSYTCLFLTRLVIMPEDVIGQTNQ